MHFDSTISSNEKPSFCQQKAKDPHIFEDPSANLSMTNPEESPEKDTHMKKNYNDAVENNDPPLEAIDKEELAALFDISFNKSSPCDKNQIEQQQKISNICHACRQIQNEKDRSRLCNNCK